MEDWQKRVVEERTSLLEKLDALDEFIDGAVYDGLPLEDRRRLDAQQSVMSAYLAILSMRIDAFEKAA